MDAAHRVVEANVTNRQDIQLNIKFLHGPFPLGGNGFFVSDNSSGRFEITAPVLDKGNRAEMKLIRGM